MEQQCCRCGAWCEAAPPPDPLPPWEPKARTPPEEHGGYRLEPYGNSRYWQVTDPAGELVCLTVYKRGGREVMRRLAA